MCGTCGCGEHHHHDHLHDHEYWHGHEHHHRHHGEGKVITLEQDILQRNNLLAERNRGYFEAKYIFCLNLMPLSFVLPCSIWEKRRKSLSSVPPKGMTSR